MSRIIGYSQTRAGIEVDLDCGCKALLAEDKVMLVAWNKEGFDKAVESLERHVCPTSSPARPGAPNSRALLPPSDD